MNLENIVYKTNRLLGKARVSVKDDETLNCSVGIDGNFILGMGVLLVSIMENNVDRNINFHIFTDKFIDREILNLQRIVEKYPRLIISIYYLDTKFFDKFPAEFIWTTAIYYRFLVPIEMKKLDIKNVWYLDSDELCVNRIVDFDIEQNIPMAGITYKPQYAERKMLLQKLSGREDILDIQSAGIYINVDTWIKDKISERALSSLLEDDLRYYKFFDGDALIKAINNNVLPMELKYNYCYNLVNDHHEIPKDIIFVHFAGTTKPWKAWAQDNEKTKLWLEYKSRSPWKNYKLDMPKNYREAKFMRRYMQRLGDTSGAIKWYIKYAWWKILGKNKL